MIPIKVGQVVRVSIPAIGEEEARTIIGPIKGINVPCMVAMGLLGHLVEDETDGSLHHVDPNWVSNEWTEDEFYQHQLEKSLQEAYGPNAVRPPQ